MSLSCDERMKAGDVFRESEFVFGENDIDLGEVPHANAEDKPEMARRRPYDHRRSGTHAML